jgi:exodeoxyribonuclease VII large subunit
VSGGRKVEATLVGERRVFSVSAFNEGISIWLRRLPEVWVEGEVTDLRRNEAWATVFLTLKDPDSGSCLPVTMQRRRFDGLELGLANGERVHVHGRAEVYEAKGELAFRARTIERFGLGEHLAALERLKATLAAEGLFEASRKRQLPRFPRAVGLLTGADAAARGDLVTGIRTRFPPAHLVIAETRVQGPGAPRRIAEALGRLASHPLVDVVVLARGGGSFEDLLPFSDETVVRAVAACPVPIVSAVGHEQDTPLCDLAADSRASTPTAAARLVVPDLDELAALLRRNAERLRPATGRVLARGRERLTAGQSRLRAAPALVLERRRTGLDRTGARLAALSPRATLARGYAVVRADGRALRDTSPVAAGTPLEIELAAGGLGAVVTEVRT